MQHFQKSITCKLAPQQTEIYLLLKTTPCVILLIFKSLLIEAKEDTSSLGNGTGTNLFDRNNTFVVTIHSFVSKAFR